MDLNPMRESKKKDPNIHGVYNHLSLTCIPAEIFTLKNLKSLDLSNNKLTRFPGKMIAQELTRLESLDLHCNMLYMLEDVIDLSTMPRLRELNFIQNPVRLLNNRIYLLEALLKAPGCETDVLIVVERDAELKNKVLEQKDTLYLMSLPRKKGFPMLQRLNDQWITELETKAVEKEMGHKIEYFWPYQKNGAKKNGNRSKSRKEYEKAGRHYDGSYMSITKILYKESKARGVIAKPVIQRFQFDATDCEALMPLGGEDELEENQNKWLGPSRHDPSNAEEDFDDIDEGESHSGASEDEYEEEKEEEEEENAHTILQTVLSNTTALLNQNGSDETEDNKPQEQVQAAEEEESWNYPISTFDKLGSEDRSYVRLKSKHVAGNTVQLSTASTTMNPKQFLHKDFQSSIFLDCVAQSERSRRLTVKAVDLLTEPLNGTNSSLQLSSSCANLRRKLNKEFNKTVQQETFQRVDVFSQHQVQVGDTVIQSDVSDLFQADHLVQKKKNRQAHVRIFKSQGTTNDSSSSSSSTGWTLEQVEQNIEDSLSRLKLRNAMDLANSLGNSHRMLENLIQADQKVIEEERIQQEYQNHRMRLANIMQRPSSSSILQDERDQEVTLKSKKIKTASTTKFISPWQERNHRAKQATAHGAKHSKKKRQAILMQQPIKTVELYKTIETLEMASKDSLDSVNSHDLLVRCAEIRRQADKSIQSLASYKDKFIEEEAAWETIRQDPINLLKRRIRRRQLKEDPILNQEIQIGSAQIGYSSLFLQ